MGDRFEPLPGAFVPFHSGLRERLILSALTGAAYKIGSTGGFGGSPLVVSALDVRLMAEKAVLLADMVMKVMADEQT